MRAGIKHHAAAVDHRGVDRPPPMPVRRPLRRWPWLAALSLVGAVLVATGAWFEARQDDARDARTAAIVIENELTSSVDFGRVISGRVAEADVPALLPFIQARAGRARGHARRLQELSPDDPDVRALNVALGDVEQAMDGYARSGSKLWAVSLWAGIDRIVRLTPKVLAAQEDRAASLAWQARAGQLTLLAVALLLMFTVLSLARRAVLTEADRHAARLQDLALHDPLTGLPNRRHFEQDAAALEGAVTVVLCDLDRFKPFNDRHGHAAGDALLVEAGHALADELADRGRIYRLGGDEFCGLVHQPDLDVVPRLERAVARRLAASGVTASAGAALVPAEAADPRTGLRLADERMYAAKATRHAAAAMAPAA